MTSGRGQRCPQCNQSGSHLAGCPGGTGQTAASLQHPNLRSTTPAARATVSPTAEPTPPAVAAAPTAGPAASDTTSRPSGDTSGPAPLRLMRPNGQGSRTKGVRVHRTRRARRTWLELESQPRRRARRLCPNVGSAANADVCRQPAAGKTQHASHGLASRNVTTGLSPHLLRPTPRTMKRSSPPAESGPTWPSSTKSARSRARYVGWSMPSSIAIPSSRDRGWSSGALCSAAFSAGCYFCSRTARPVPTSP
jgi:hypothetical protein